MKFLLDTNTCIRYLNGTSEFVKNHFKKHLQTEIAICSVVKAELFYGAFKSKHPRNNLNKIRQFFLPFKSYHFDDSASEYYGQIRTSLEKAGTPIGPNDLLIASIALSNQLILVTHNVGEFSRIDQLTIEDWEQEI